MVRCRGPGYFEWKLPSRMFVVFLVSHDHASLSQTLPPIDNDWARSHGFRDRVSSPQNGGNYRRPRSTPSGIRARIEAAATILDRRPPWSLPLDSIFAPRVKGAVQVIRLGSLAAVQAIYRPHGGMRDDWPPLPRARASSPRHAAAQLTWLHQAITRFCAAWCLSDGNDSAHPSTKHVPVVVWVVRCMPTALSPL